MRVQFAGSSALVLLASLTCALVDASAGTHPHLRNRNLHPNETPECTESDPDLICIALFSPVECNGCIYNNGCFAGGAGYSEEDCVLLQEEPILVNPDVLSECSKTDPNFICSAIFAPVRCLRDGDDDSICEYGNQCLASGAGYSETDCDPAP
jgi:hypothetical protein